MSITPTIQRTAGNSWAQYGIANGAGGGAGQAVTVAVAVQDGVLPASAQYGIDIEVSQDCTAFVSSKTASGFNVTLTPRLAANTLAAGTFNVLLTW